MNADTAARLEEALRRHNKRWCSPGEEPGDPLDVNGFHWRRRTEIANDLLDAVSRRDGGEYLLAIGRLVSDVSLEKARLARQKVERANGEKWEKERAANEEKAARHAAHLAVVYK